MPVSQRLYLSSFGSLFYIFIFVKSSEGSTREMVEIMQENGEVVATLGSSANYHNIKIFLASDASLAVEPLYPQVNHPILR